MLECTNADEGVELHLKSLKIDGKTLGMAKNHSDELPCEEGISSEKKVKSIRILDNIL